jgi:hypothetical protein
MAQYPCEKHGARYKGAQQTIYPALLNGTTRLGHKVRVCPSCMAEVMDWIQVNMSPAESQLGVFSCWGCGAQDSPWAMFVTVYAEGQERQDFFGRSCGACVTAAGNALFSPADAILSLF